MRRDPNSANEDLLIPLTPLDRAAPTVVESEDGLPQAFDSDGPLSDGFGRQLKNLRVSITDRCNFRCTYCMPEEGLIWLKRDQLLSYEEIERLVRIFVARSSVLRLCRIAPRLGGCIVSRKWCISSPISRGGRPKAISRRRWLEKTLIASG